MPCYLCAGAVVQFGIQKVIVGQSRTFAGAVDFMRSHGVEVIDLDLPKCIEMMRTFIAERRELWNEAIGRSLRRPRVHRVLLALFLMPGGQNFRFALRSYPSFQLLPFRRLGFEPSQGIPRR